MDSERVLRIQLDDEIYFRRYFATAAADEKEIEVGTAGDLTRGYVTGVDPSWVTMTLSSDLSPVLIRIGAITSVRQTGKTVDSLGADSARKVRGYAEVFTRVSRRELERVKSLPR